MKPHVQNRQIIRNFIPDFAQTMIGSLTTDREIHRMIGKMGNQAHLSKRDLDWIEKVVKQRKEHLEHAFVKIKKCEEYLQALVNIEKREFEGLNKQWT